MPDDLKIFSLISEYRALLFCPLLVLSPKRTEEEVQRWKRRLNTLFQQRFPLFFLRSGSFMRLSGTGPVLNGRHWDMKPAEWNLSPYCCWLIPHLFLAYWYDLGCFSAGNSRIMCDICLWSCAELPPVPLPNLLKWDFSALFPCLYCRSQIFSASKKQSGKLAIRSCKRLREMVYYCKTVGLSIEVFVWKKSTFSVCCALW